MKSKDTPKQAYFTITRDESDATYRYHFVVAIGPSEAMDSALKAANLVHGYQPGQDGGFSRVQAYGSEALESLLTEMARVQAVAQAAEAEDEPSPRRHVPLPEGEDDGEDVKTNVGDTKAGDACHPTEDIDATWSYLNDIALVRGFAVLKSDDTGDRPYSAFAFKPDNPNEVEVGRLHALGDADDILNFLMRYSIVRSYDWRVRRKVRLAQERLAMFAGKTASANPAAPTDKEAKDIEEHLARSHQDHWDTDAKYGDSVRRYAAVRGFELHMYVDGSCYLWTSRGRGSNKYVRKQCVLEQVKLRDVMKYLCSLPSRQTRSNPSASVSS
ncbi:MAG: hypothetical protein ACLQU3_14510 [Limisphaerales bacterium]